MNKLPKAILHEHIEGSVTANMAEKLAAKHQIKLPDQFIYSHSSGDQQLFPYGRYHYDQSDFSSFIATYDIISSLVQTADDYNLITYDFLSRNAQLGMIYCELIISPYHFCATTDHNGMTSFDSHRYQEVMAAMSQAITDVQSKFGVETRLHVVAVRQLGEAYINRMMDFLTEHPHPLISGFNIAGDERIGNFSDFQYAHKIAAQLGLGKSYHAGEICSANSIRQALEAGANRIGHGIKLIEDPQLINELIAKQVTLEISLTSNVMLVNELKGRIENHPLRKLYDAGVRLCLNTDDAGIFATDIAKEYQLAQQHFHFSDAELVDITLSALESAFIQDKLKAELMKKVYAACTNEIKTQLDTAILQAKSSALAERLKQRKQALSIHYDSF